MARQKPILTKSRVAMSIAKSDATPQQKRAALGQYAQATRAARGDAGKVYQPGNLAGRIRNARQDARDLAVDRRIDHARAQQQRQLRRRESQFSPAEAAIAPRKTSRSVGRERTGLLGHEGQRVPTPSARVDAIKPAVGLGLPNLAKRMVPRPGG
jgi:hypothetical protein